MVANKGCAAKATSAILAEECENFTKAVTSDCLSGASVWSAVTRKAVTFVENPHWTSTLAHIHQHMNRISPRYRFAGRIS